jgi:hypothetical protein
VTVRQIDVNDPYSVRSFAAQDEGRSKAIELRKSLLGHLPVVLGESLWSICKLDVNLSPPCLIVMVRSLKHKVQDQDQDTHHTSEYPKVYQCLLRVRIHLLFVNSCSYSSLLTGKCVILAWRGIFMALRPLYANVVNRTITFMAGTTDEMVREALAFTKIPIELISIDRATANEVRVHISPGYDLPERVQVPEHLYTWVK